jgi:crotonobetainyl-CoA:carnitine CoA-transferase CaiB-like acyl-CoA transferase
MERGLDFESLTAHNQRLTYCAITAYGEDGPWADYPAHGLNVDAFAGLVPVVIDNGMPDPDPNYMSVGTTLAGVHAALGIMSALHRQRTTGQPQRVDVSIWGAAMWWNWRHMTAIANLQTAWRSYSELGSRYSTYATIDGRVVLVCPIERRFWLAFCEALDLPADWKARGNWTTGADYGYDEEKPTIKDAVARLTLSEMVDVLAKAGIPFAPLLTFAEALNQNLLTSTTIGGAAFRIPRAPARIAGGGVSTTDNASENELSPPPLIGEHTEDILAEIGLKDSIQPELAN